MEISTGISQLLVKRAGSPVWSPVKGSAIQQLPDCSGGWTRLVAGGKAKVAGAPTDPPNRVRSAPSTSSDLIGQIYPGTELRLIEGPVCADGYIFWKVESDVIPGGTGWTAEGDGNEYFLDPVNP